VFELNEKQRRIAKRWQQCLLDFIGREWTPALLWSVAGALLAAVARLTFFDKHFLPYAKKTYFPNTFSFDGPLIYRPYAIAVVVLIALLAFTRSTGIVRRGVKSWLVGCTSGIPFFSLLSACFLLMFRNSQVFRHTVIYIGSNIAFWFVSFGLYLFGRVHALRAITEDELRVSDMTRAATGTMTAAIDEPIQSWEEDALDRASVVDIVSSKAMIGRASVIALSGPLGIGKTSVLNLLQTHLHDKAIVVRFVTWLPGSQDALSSYLLADIANECRKYYVVPGLRRSASRVARALAQTVPFLKGTLEFIPATTQRDDMIALQNALSRIPRRVIVLLDELDRMEKEEIVTLLKMLRGISQMPNCTFVCALDLEELIQTVRGNREDDSRRYFEKFFPTTVTLPKLDGETLRRVAVQRITQLFEREEWFKTPAEQSTFDKELQQCWDEMAAPFCGTLRSIALLATDIDIVATLLKRQVDPLELTLIEVLRRFQPDVYRLVSRNARTLTGGESWVRGGGYISDDRKKREDELFTKELKEAIKPQDTEAISALLKRLFPKFAGLDGHSWHARTKRQETENSYSISEPSMFSAYFQFEIPEAVFSSLELEQFLEAFWAAKNDAGRGVAYRTTLEKLPKGSLKRDDFLRKLADVIRSMDQKQAAMLALVAVYEAKEYTYDLFAGFGEAGHVIRLVIRAAEKMSHDEKVQFLSRCINIASDDTLALRILVNLTNSKSDVRLEVSYQELVPAFRQRMRKLYGPSAEAATMDLSTSDSAAFNQWGWQSEEVGHDPEDRKLQRDFWLRRIGTSRKKLAEVFDTFLLPSQYHYSSDPTPFVENKLPLPDLERLLRELPETEKLADKEKAAILRLQKLLAGEFRNGVPIVMD
jgi:hypothetical protein